MCRRRVRDLSCRIWELSLPCCRRGVVIVVVVVVVVLNYAGMEWGM